MRPIWNVLAAALCVIGCQHAEAGAAAGPWGNLTVWEGHYPSDVLPGAPGGFFALPAVRRGLAEILSPADRRRLAAYAVQGQIEPTGQYEVVGICRPHDCPAENATVILDKTAPRLWVAFYAHIGQVVSVRWYGTDDYEHLPPDVLNQVLYRHEPRP